LIEELDNLQKTEFKKKVFADYAERYQYFVGFGFLLLLIEATIQKRKNPLIKRLNLFNS